MSVVPSSASPSIDLSPATACEESDAIRDTLIIKKGDMAASVPPWNKQLQPERATAISRFRPDVDIPSVAMHPVAHTVFSARCEVTDSKTCMPTSALALASSGSCVALAAFEDHKSYASYSSYWVPRSNGDMEERHVQTGLGFFSSDIAVDDARKLVFFADQHRIKSFHVNDGNAVHTMRSGACKGPLAALPGGRLARAGKGCAAIWNLDALQTHGESGKNKVGKGSYCIPGYPSKNGNVIEPSTGNIAHTTVKFPDASFKPSVWHLHQPTSYMLCAEHPAKSEEDSGSSAHRIDPKPGYVSFDLVHGKTVSSYSELCYQVTEFSTSDSDPNTIATAGSDGYARLYDVRQQLPQLTVDVNHDRRQCSAVALAHPDGIPVLFTGQHTDGIKLWDLRAKKVVYELATGNNGVYSIAWDAANATLYASTTSRYTMCHGFCHSYRPYKPPRFNKDQSANEDDGVEKEDADADADDTGKAWPTEAPHSEDYFGYAFDAGEHRLYRYRFREDANLEMVPRYGNATCENPGYWR